VVIDIIPLVLPGVYKYKSSSKNTRYGQESFLGPSTTLSIYDGCLSLIFPGMLS